MRNDHFVRSENSIPGEVTGPVVQVGTLHGDVHLNSAGSTSSHYLAQVARIAPARLVGRDAELAELADFCTSASTEGQYAWWRAEAWSGKSALLSWFVLHPPPNVRVLSFFITARLAGQSDRYAFLDNLLEQLLALLDEPTRPHQTESTREAYFLGLLADAAQRCREGGEHLVLVVDGLDEDRSVDGTPDAHSITALLPAGPLPGLRVVVAGRPNPPIPADVPDYHPLRLPDAIRRLAPSPEARALRHLMERDLKRLLSGSAEDRDLLGLLTAAGGGLTIPDLAHLTGTSTWQVDDRLRTVAGRSFVRRSGLRPGSSPDVHLLAHEQLHLTAVDMLGGRLDDYRRRLHHWADSYRDRRWSPDTPEYLLQGYFGMLTATGDLTRMVACATEPDRHRCLLALSGGDATSLAEITASQDLVLARTPSDLEVLARLAVHRDHIHRQTGRIPFSLPAGWARLGQPGRAASIVEAMQDPVIRVRALLSMASVVFTADRGRATELLDRAEVLARSFEQLFGSGLVVQVAEAFAVAGDLDRAEEVARLVHGVSERASALASLAIRATDEGDAERASALLGSAEELSRSERSGWRMSALASMAEAASRMARTAQATAMLDEAEQILVSVSGPISVSQVEAMAKSAAAAGDYDRALRVTAVIGDLDGAVRCLMSIIAAAAERDPDRAEAIARTTNDVELRCRGVARLARAVAGTGDHARAMSLAAEVEGTAEGFPDPARSEVLMGVAIAVADAGDLDRAEALAKRCAVLSGNADGVLSIAMAALRAGDVARGAELLNLAEGVARASTSPEDEKRSVLWVKVMADRRDFARAEALAGSLRDRTARSAAWAAVTEGVTAAGLFDRAATALGSVEETGLQRRPRHELVRAVMATGDFARAETIADAASDLTDRVTTLVVVAEMARSGDLVRRIGKIIIAAAERIDQQWAWASLLEVAANIEDQDLIATLLRRLRATAAHAVGSADQVATRTATRHAFALASLRIRILADVPEVAASHSGHSFLPRDAYTDVVPLAEPSPARSDDLPPDQALARKLREQHWYYAVEDLVELHPHVYRVITAELDRLAEHGLPPA